MDGNLAMANSLENGAEPADIFEYEYGFNKRQSVALESLYMDESLAGRYKTIHDFAKKAQRLLLTDESSGLHKHVVNGSAFVIMFQKKPLKNILFQSDSEARNYVKMQNPNRTFKEIKENVFVCTKYGSTYQIVELHYR